MHRGLKCSLLCLVAFFGMHCKTAANQAALQAADGATPGCNDIVDVHDYRVGKLKHPGTLFSVDDLKRIRRLRGSSDPNHKRALKLLFDTTPVDYKPQPVADFYVEWEKTEAMKAQHRQLVEKDGVQSYQQTIAFLVTCDKRYASNVKAILNAWATQNRGFRGRNAPLEGAWAVASMARAAELLKHTDRDWDPEIEKRFLAWVATRIEPEMNKMVWWHYSTWNNNWHTTIAEAKLQLAILRDDDKGFLDMLRYYERIVDGVVAFEKRTKRNESDRYLTPSGQTTETCRDIAHAQFGIGSLIQIPEMAWHQGVDVYSKKQGILVKMLEYHAPLVRGEPVYEGTVDIDLRSVTYGKPCVMAWVGFQPTWEIGYNHFVRRKGLSLPESAKTLARFRPERYVFHWGLGTLTHYQPY